MNPGVHVQSVAAIEQFRSATVSFQHESVQALGSVEAELRRFLQWLKFDQAQYWKHESRRSEERVAEAKNDLHRCQNATIDPHRTPSCLQEKKVLAAAKRRLEIAEERLTAVRRWIPIVEQAAFEYLSAVEPLSTTLAAGIPRALADLDRALSTIEAYLAVAPPPAELPSAASDALSGTNNDHAKRLP